MLSKKQKIARFKLKAVKNYRASLSLEGLSVRKDSSNQKIGDLKVKYAR